MTRTDAQVAAIVVSHDSGQCLLDCIDDLLGQDEPVDIVVVDNASRDGAPQKLPSDPRLKVLYNAGNPGFSVACNQGAERASAPFLMFVNPDCRLPADTVRRLRQTLQSEPKVGLLGAQLLNADGSEQAASRRATPRPMQAIRAMLWVNNGTAGGKDAPASFSSVERVGAISGALMFTPRELFERLHGFDTGYVLHCEDLDLCRRMSAAGYDVALAPSVRVTHLKGTSSRRRPVWVEWQKHRGMLRYFRKFDAASSPWWLRLVVPLGIATHFPLAAFKSWWRA